MATNSLYRGIIHNWFMDEEWNYSSSEKGGKKWHFVFRLQRSKPHCGVNRGDVLVFRSSVLPGINSVTFRKSCILKLYSLPSHLVGKMLCLDSEIVPAPHFKACNPARLCTNCIHIFSQMYERAHVFVCYQKPEPPLNTSSSRAIHSVSIQ